jgi:hypothetical protein
MVVVPIVHSVPATPGSRFIKQEFFDLARGEPVHTQTHQPYIRHRPYRFSDEIQSFRE